METFCQTKSFSWLLPQIVSACWATMAKWAYMNSGQICHFKMVKMFGQCPNTNFYLVKSVNIQIWFKLRALQIDYSSRALTQPILLEGKRFITSSWNNACQGDVHHILTGLYTSLTSFNLSYVRSAFSPKQNILRKTPQLTLLLTQNNN